MIKEVEPDMTLSDMVFMMGELNAHLEARQGKHYFVFDSTGNKKVLYEKEVGRWL